MIGRFPSLKMRRMVAFESLIEQDYLYLLDFEPDVLAFSEQPLQIEYVWEEKKHHYTPDFHVILEKGFGGKPTACFTSNERSYEICLNISETQSHYL